MNKAPLLCIIDDDPIQQFIMNKAVSIGNINAELLSFSSGKEAFINLSSLSKAGHRLPDVILIDLNMPGWKGWEFLDALQTEGLFAQIKVYVLTSSKNPKEEAKASTYENLDGFIVKPITIDWIKKILSNV